MKQKKITKERVDGKKKRRRKGKRSWKVENEEVNEDERKQQNSA